MDAHHDGHVLLPEDVLSPVAEPARLAETRRRSLERRLDGWMGRVDRTLKAIAREEVSRRR